MDRPFNQVHNHVPFLRRRASEEEKLTGQAQLLMSQALDADEAGNADKACELYMEVQGTQKTFACHECDTLIFFLGSDFKGDEVL